MISDDPRGAQISHDGVGFSLVFEFDFAGGFCWAAFSNISEVHVWNRRFPESPPQPHHHQHIIRLPQPPLSKMCNKFFKVVSFFKIHTTNLLCQIPPPSHSLLFIYYHTMADSFVIFLFASLTCIESTGVLKPIWCVHLWPSHEPWTPRFKKVSDKLANHY